MNETVSIMVYCQHPQIPCCGSILCCVSCTIWSKNVESVNLWSPIYQQLDPKLMTQENVFICKTSSGSSLPPFHIRMFSSTLDVIYDVIGLVASGEIFPSCIRTCFTFAGTEEPVSSEHSRKKSSVLLGQVSSQHRLVLETKTLGRTEIVHLRQVPS